MLRSQKEKALNLAYGRVVRRRAAYHAEAGEPDRSRAELSRLQKDLATRGANPSVLAQYENLGANLIGKSAA